MRKYARKRRIWLFTACPVFQDEKRPRLTSMHFLRTHVSLRSQARGLINGSGRANPDHGQRSSTNHITRVHCFLSSIYTHRRRYIYTFAPRQRMQCARRGASKRESATWSEMRWVSYISHDAPTCTGLTSAFGCACTRWWCI